MPSPLNIRCGDEICLTWRNPPKFLTDKGPVWNTDWCMFRSFIEHGGEKTGLIARMQLRGPSGPQVVDQRIEFSDLLMLGTVEGTVVQQAVSPRDVELAKRDAAELMEFASR